METDTERLVFVEVALVYPKPKTASTILEDNKHFFDIFDLPWYKEIEKND